MEILFSKRTFSSFVYFPLYDNQSVIHCDTIHIYYHLYLLERN